MFLFLLNDTPNTEIYTLSLHDALPISQGMIEISPFSSSTAYRICASRSRPWLMRADRKSTRLNSSHGYISYAVFCLKKKKNIDRPHFYARLRVRDKATHWPASEAVVGL